MIQKVMTTASNSALVEFMSIAKELGYKTGGYHATYTIDKEIPSESILKKKYNMKSLSGQGYIQCAELILQQVQGSLIFLPVGNTLNGSLLNLLLLNCNKPYLVNPKKEEFLQWVERHSVKDLFITGLSLGKTDEMQLLLFNTLLRHLLS